MPINNYAIVNRTKVLCVRRRKSYIELHNRKIAYNKNAPLSGALIFLQRGRIACGHPSSDELTKKRNAALYAWHFLYLCFMQTSFSTPQVQKMPPPNGGSIAFLCRGEGSRTIISTCFYLRQKNH